MGVVLVRTFILMGMAMNLVVGTIALSFFHQEWFAPLFAVVVFQLVLFIVALIGYLRITYDMVHEDPGRREGTPYWLRNAMEDVIARNVNQRVMLRNLDEFIRLAEWDLESQSELIGQIRNGEYDKDQPAAQKKNRHPKDDSTRGNAK